MLSCRRQKAKAAVGVCRPAAAVSTCPRSAPEATSGKDGTLRELGCSDESPRRSTSTHFESYVMSMPDSALALHQLLTPSHIADLRLAASTMTGRTRRALQGELALQYGGGIPLLADTLFGWGRHTVEG